MSRFLSRRFASLAPYTPGEQPQGMEYVKLNTNESPYPPAPGVIAALSAAEVSRLNLYSDPQTKALTNAIAKRYGLFPAQVLPGNGSDEILVFCFEAFCGEDAGACFADLTYGFYEVYARLFCLETKVIALSERFTIEPEAYFNAGKTVFIANPNAPTGVFLALGELEEILKHNRENVVVIDEAYVDFGGESAVSLLARYENLLVVQTFSKSRNLAGARLGFAMGSEQLIGDLMKMKFSFNPYNINRLSILAGAAAMEDGAYFEACTKKIMQTREAVAVSLEERGFFVLPSRANFVFAAPKRIGGEAYYKKLKEKGVLVRWFDRDRIRDFVRITIGSDAQMKTLLNATDQILEETK